MSYRKFGETLCKKYNKVTQKLTFKAKMRSVLSCSVSVEALCMPVQNPQKPSNSDSLCFGAKA